MEDTFVLYGREIDIVISALLALEQIDGLTTSEAVLLDELLCY